VVDGVHLTFIPVMETDDFGDDVVEQLKIHLVNRTTIGYRFIYKLNYFGENSFELVNQVHPFEDFYLHDIPFESLNDNPAFSFEFSLVTPDKNKADHYESNLKLKPKQVFARIEQLKQKGEATFSYKLFDEYPGKPYEEPVEMSALVKAGYKLYEAEKARQHMEPAKHELDLHIEKLTPDWENMDNFEKLALQLKTFDKYFDLALAHHLPSFIIIHGVGTGKLRDEIHEQLKLRREVKSFLNRYHPAYGYGATEVFFQY
jgi:hypothetical protein